MQFLQPRPGGVFMISGVPEWPSIEFETDTSGPHIWSWTLTWRTYRVSGVVPTDGNKWNAHNAVRNYGGTLAVRAQAGEETAAITVSIRGENPIAHDVRGYLSRKAPNAGFEKIIAHETGYKHFNASREPVKSMNDGYGMCQLAHPKPGFDQIWNWRLNIEAGLHLFEQKRASAMAYLSQAERAYTSEQLKYETVSRWRDGAYHRWNATTSRWERNPDIEVCYADTVLA